MASASSTSAKNLFVESKLRLADRVQVNVNNVAAVARQIQRGSRSNEILMVAAKNFAAQDSAIENSETNIKKLKFLSSHLTNQYDTLNHICGTIEAVLEEVRSMQR